MTPRTHPVEWLLLAAALLTCFGTVGAVVNSYLRTRRRLDVTTGRYPPRRREW